VQKKKTKNGGPIGGCALDKGGPWARGGIIYGWIEKKRVFRQSGDGHDSFVLQRRRLPGADAHAGDLLGLREEQQLVVPRGDSSALPSN
jgi:hypothetical protein